MPKVTRPDMASVWAEVGNVSAIPSEKISKGWIVEIPPYEQANFVENRQDRGIAYLLQQGIPEWSSLIEYQTSSFIQYDNIVYKAVGVNTNKQPNNFPLIWKVAFDAASSAQRVQDQLNAIKADPDPFTQYLLETRATANGIDANLILTNKLEMVNLNIVDAVGEYYVDATCTNKPFSAGLMKVWVEAKGLATYQLVQAFGGEGIATRVRDNASDWSKWAYSVTSDTAIDLSVLQDQISSLTSRLASITEAAKIKVGDLYLTTHDFLAPSEVTTFLGYGTWARYGEGRTLVSKSTQPLDPAWTKIQNAGYGGYTHGLTVNQLPSHDHTVQISSDSNSVSFVNETHGLSTNPNNIQTSAVPIGSTGLGERFEIVQPSIVVGIWYRTV